MQSETLARLKTIIADAEADMAEHFSDAKETGERADLADAEVCLLVDDAKAIVAALSAAEPEPVAWYWEDKSGCFHITMDRPDVQEMAAEFFCDPRPLYDRPQQPAPSVAVKEGQMINNMLLSQVLQNAFFAGRGTSGIVSPEDMAAWQDYDPYNLEAYKRIRSALSAQVQDVAGPVAEIVEAKTPAAQLIYGFDVSFFDALRGLPIGTKLYAAPQVQDVAGWQLVPKQPTEEMLDAYWGQTGESEAMRSRVHARAKIHYHVMLAAAPAKQEGGTSE